MLFIRQIKYEIRNILKSKFILIMAILAIAACVAIPVIGYFSGSSNPGEGGSIKPTMIVASRDIAYSKGGYYGGPNNGESITIDGVTITSENPFFWNISSLQQEMKYMESGQNQFKYPATLDLLLEMMNAELDYYLQFAKLVTRSQDYRVDLVWRGTESLIDVFFYGHLDVPENILMETASFRKTVDPDTIRRRYLDSTAAERQAGLIKADSNLAQIFSIVENDNFGQYIDLRIKLENDQITELKASIAIQVEAIIKNPTQEESLNQVIEGLQKQIQVIETNNIPILKYRLEKNIRPGEDVWQNTALYDIENSRSQLVYLVIMTEEEFNENSGPERKFDAYYSGVGGIQSYPEYVASMQRQIDRLNKIIGIAQKSLDANKPDLKYVPNGSRSRTVRFLDYSMFVALFGVLLGGWLIASEFQQGTIRLLMIRPKTRTKILLAKFFAAILICLFVDVAGSLLNILSNGILFGFADYAYPIYGISSTTGFFAYYLPRMLACMLTILFAFTAAFMLSVTVRNIAVSIAVPIIMLIGSIIVMGIFAYSNTITWLPFTPIPFIQISAFFQQYSTVQTLIENGVNLSLPYGITLLLALSAAFTLISIVVFKKRDITN